MCGIAGFVGGNWSSDDQAKAILRQMIAKLKHRGPDHQDAWTDPEAHVGFAHSRLSILDLSSAGNQPMHSPSGRYVITYNGEIYNHREIRAKLGDGGFAGEWRGESDTETLLAAIERWGVRTALGHSIGMFAFALWDRQTRTLTLARDRLGEKPLYYGRQRQGEAFLFGSELKAIAQHPCFRSEVNPHALKELLRYNYIPAPSSIYRGIAKLVPGTFLTLKDTHPEPTIETYWSANELAERGVANPVALTEEEATVRLETLLECAIRRQMIADVPLGAFLSGGVDSSAVVAVMQKLARRPVKTFTIGFNEKDYDEAEHAKAVALHLGTDHTQLYVTPEQARSVIPMLPRIYDEPFADSSQIPTYLVAALAREQVTVALSGDGGDEVFGGYNRYLYTAELWGRISALPKSVRAAAARALTLASPSAWTAFGNRTRRFLPRLARVDRLGDKVHKGASLMTSQSVQDLYLGMTSHWRDPDSIVTSPDQSSSVTSKSVPSFALGPIERMMASDLVGYLPGDILVKVDRAAMAVSLETRVPFLDPDLIEFAWSLPLRYRLRRGTTKWLLRQLLYRHVPGQLVERPKMGFGMPIGSWLRGPLREWAEELLDERRLRNEGYFRPEPIRQMWEAHLNGAVDEEHRLWIVLMFQQWADANGHQAINVAD
jgi:asparagine synthase (glutamine-hydrolysing)